LGSGFLSQGFFNGGFESVVFGPVFAKATQGRQDDKVIFYVDGLGDFGVKLGEQLRRPVFVSELPVSAYGYAEAGAEVFVSLREASRSLPFYTTCLITVSVRRICERIL